MGYTQSIVTEIKRKSAGAFEASVNFGTKQKYISTLLNSHNNNLEEQSILGVDCYTVTWKDDNNINHITKKFYDGDISSISGLGYYILFIEDYTDSEYTDEFFFKNNSLYLPAYGTSKASFVFNQEKDCYTINLKDSSIYNYDEETELLKINPTFKIFKRELLCFRKNISNQSDEQIDTDIIISEKITSKRIGDDGKFYTKEYITNYLED